MVSSVSGITESPTRISGRQASHSIASLDGYADILGEIAPAPFTCSNVALKSDTGTTVAGGGDSAAVSDQLPTIRPKPEDQMAACDRSQPRVGASGSYHGFTLQSDAAVIASQDLDVADDRVEDLVGLVIHLVSEPATLDTLSTSTTESERMLLGSDLGSFEPHSPTYMSEFDQLAGSYFTG